jgi:ribulose-5-phosphate 4-epimerase/fuculose-1-phosphate aldolase
VAQIRDLKAAGAEKIFQEQLSSVDAKRPQLEAAIDFCREAAQGSKCRNRLTGRSTHVDAILEKRENFELPLRAPGASFEAERLYRKQRLAATFRLFGVYGFDQGLAGHITVRDPEFSGRYWINPLGKFFRQIRVSDLVLIDSQGNTLEGGKPVNGPGVLIHSAIHDARPDVVAVAHTHSTYGKAWSALGRLLDPITQDACAFYEDHSLFHPFAGLFLTRSEAGRLAEALGSRKAVILQNHGLLTVGATVEAAAWWFIAMDNAARTQLLAEAAGTVKPIPPEMARLAAAQTGTPRDGIFNFHPLWEWIVAEEPDLLN